LLVLPGDAPWFTPGRLAQIIEQTRQSIVLQTEEPPQP
jgi:molybdopterin-guanine dinucleotide biosynthesis protein A